MASLLRLTRYREKLLSAASNHDPKSGRYSLDWGLMLMLLPAAFAMLAVFWEFFLVLEQPETAGAPFLRRLLRVAHRKRPPEVLGVRLVVQKSPALVF